MCPKPGSDPETRHCLSRMGASDRAASCLTYTQPQTGTETTTGTACLAFGDPPTPDREQVLACLERIFLASTARTRADPDNERAQQLARRRAPALPTEYKTMGGSIYNAHRREQVTTVGDQLRDRGYEAETYLGLQHTEPLIETAVERAWDDGINRLISVPLYPLCGPSTTASAVADLGAAAEDVDGEIDLQALTGWHRHPTYTQLRAENIADTLNERSVALADEHPVFVFSAHGTPIGISPPAAGTTGMSRITVLLSLPVSASTSA
jgi:ferrochelatase